MRLLPPPPQTFLAAIPDGHAGTRATLKVMRDLTRMGRRTPSIRLKATQIVLSVPAKNWIGEIRALFEFVQGNIRYTRDIIDVETLHTADQVLQQGVGDCDDMAILLASLLGSVGHATRFVACNFRPGPFSHVFTQTRLGKGWISCDPTTQNSLGWQPPGIYSASVIDNKDGARELRIK